MRGGALISLAVLASCGGALRETPNERGEGPAAHPAEAGPLGELGSVATPGVSPEPPLSDTSDPGAGGRPDAGTSFDAGESGPIPDAATVDAGVAPADAGATDAGASDAGTPDAGASDCAAQCASSSGEPCVSGCRCLSARRLWWEDFETADYRRWSGQDYGAGYNGGYCHDNGLVRCVRYRARFPTARKSPVPMVRTFTVVTGASSSMGKRPSMSTPILGRASMRPTASLRVSGRVSKCPTDSGEGDG